MLFIKQTSADLFLEYYQHVLFKVLANANIKEIKDVVKNLVNARTCIQSNPTVLNLAFDGLASNGIIIPKNIKIAIQNMRIQKWVYLKSTTQYAIFIDDEKSQAYAVKALTTPIDKLNRYGSSIITAGMFELDGHYVCDGVIEIDASLGAEYRKSYSQKLAEIKKNKHFYLTPP